MPAIPWLIALSAVLALTAGCQRPAAETASAGEAHAPAAEPVVRIVKPQRKTLSRLIEQPGFDLEAFQETPLYSKIAGYVAKWNADIGDRVHKNDVLAELHVPEMKDELRQKEAAVRLATAQIEQARATVLVAQAQLERSRGQAERLLRVGQAGALDQENVAEARLGYDAARAVLEKAKADISAAEAQLGVAKANQDYAQTMLAYTQVLAPFDGVVTQRNINSGDFVQPAASGTKGLPLFVVSQIDPVRVFVNLPGAEAAWIQDGDPVSLRLQGAGGELLLGKVTRNARSLNPQTRTLRTEIDLPNPQGNLLPGMYVQATIKVEHKGAWSLPASAIVAEGDQTLCYQLLAGKAVRTLLQVGLRSGELVEVLKKQLADSSPSSPSPWEQITGEEEVVASGAGAFTNGQPVRRAETPPEEKPAAK